MGNFTKIRLWKAFILSIALILGISSSSWSQKTKAPEKDPSTITEVPLAPEGGRAIGDDCTNPIIISVPAELPYNNSNTTCGRLDNYDLGSSSCMSWYSGGEDIIYRMDVTSNTIVTLTMNPQGNTWTGMGLFQGCPGTGTCIVAAYNTGSSTNVISSVSLTAGTQYYIMIDTWPSPDCIPAFTLDIVAEIPPPPPPPGSCEYSIALYDTWGDGWNGCKLDVLVDGIVRLNDITLSSGLGPAIFYFPANTGAEITTIFTIGDYECETFYRVYNSNGVEVFYLPPNISPCIPEINPGQLYGTCPEVGAIDGYVFNYDGLAISNALVAVESGAYAYSGPDGYFLLEPVPGGDIDVTCVKDGYNTVTDVVTVVAGETTYHEFTLTQPNLVVNPLYIEETLNPNEYFTTSLNVLNNGNGPLNWNASINYVSQPILSCDYSISLFDSYGDGWNGCALDVLVNGTVVLDNITLNSGLGPATFYFNVTSGDEITTIFTPGDWVTEPYYYIYDGMGSQVWYSPTGSSGPPNVLPGQLFASCGGGQWLTLDYYSGEVNGFGDVDNVPAHLDAANTNAGEVYSGEIVVSSNPDVGTITVPVTMVILGNALVSPENLEVELTDPITGTASLSWEWNGDAFQFFLIKRDGVVIGTTTSTTYVDLLPDYGEYCYTVQAVYDEGQSAPAGPECVEWPNPEIFINPMSLEGWVWVDNQVTVYTTIYNNGIGTLYYEFPDFAETDDLRAYCAASGGCDEYISNVTIGTINNSSGCTGYGDYTSLSTEVSSGETYAITITNGNPIWTSDQCGIWVDWNLDEDFTNDGTITVSGSPGVGPYTANITVPDDAEGGPTRMRVRIVYAATPTPCGSSSFGECEDYTLNVTSGFIVAVEPSSGIIEAGDEQQIAITYSAEGFDPGTYYEELLVNSNDPDNSELIINNTMHVYVPAQFAGTVVDNDDDQPLVGVSVTAGPFQTETNELGEYNLYVDEGEYDVVFAKAGYMPLTVADTTALQGVVTPINVGLWDANYAPAFVNAEVQDDDTWCKVTWALPAGPYEIAMDDGEVDDMFVYAHSGSWNAVKFTPSGYPATVIGGKFYVGDGSFPGPFLGTEFGVAVFDDDGTNGLPGTMLDSTGVTVNNYGWVSLGWLNATITDGSFYLAMYQSENAPNAAPIGVDTDNPTYFKSYSRFQANPWALSAFQDFMIRAWVSGPEGDAITDAVGTSWKATPKVPANWQDYGMTQSGTIPKILPGYERNDVRYRSVEGMTSRDVTNYRVARYSEFDPNGSPAAGTLTELATTGNLEYNDYAWAGLDQGWYAYGVKALYTSGLYSDYAISNIVGHLMEFEVTVNVTLSTGLEPSGVEITIQGNEWPYETYFAVTPASGTVIFDPVWKGHYDITAMKAGYDTYIIENTFINSDKTYNIVLGEKKYAPSCLVVDPLTLEATWCEPLRTAMTEDFEGAQFPPAGWQATTDGEGWFRTNNGSSSSWIIPTWDSYYAVSNDDGAGSTNPGDADYLITPALDLRDAEGYFLTFNSYYDGAFGQLAFVEYTLDGGATWEVLSQMSPSAAWANISVDLAQFSGANGSSQIWFAFHADDAGAWASGWAVDNPKVEVPAPPASYLDFYVFLDDAFVGTTMETNWNYAPLMYGQEYTASVAARYTSGLSEKDYYRFVCKYLFPPRNLTGVAPDDAAILVWDPPITAPITLDGMTYEEYLAENNLQNIRSNDAPSSGRAPNANINVPQVNPFEGLRDLDSKAWACDALASNQVTFTLGNPGVLTPLGPGTSDFVSAADIVDGVYYGTIYGGTFFSMDTATGAITTLGSLPDLTGLAYDYTTETMYGVDFGGTLYTIDLETYTYATVGNTGGVLIDCACDNDGNLFAVDIGSDIFGAIDKTTAAWTTIGNLPFDANYAQGMQCDHDANVIYHAAYNNSLGAGQLYLVDQLTGGYTLIGNFQGNTEVDGFATPYESSGPGGGELPENLLGYNVYRDSDFVGYKDHVGAMVPQNYIEENLQPGIYQYTVTAVYDLSVYGFPGETGESAEEGPAEVIVDYCYDLEFMETWELGNFDANNWATDASNWSVNGQMGNPAPAAEFTWDPILTEYEVGLVSYPLCAVGMTEGKVWFDFDVKLDAYQPTGEEFLHAQVWSWDSQNWTTVASYSNVDGSFGWTNAHINIKALAMDKVFKVRFLATGMNSLNILSWFVDNVHIYRTCDEPVDLTADPVNPGTIVLNWDGPIGGNIDEWVHWDDGTNYDAIGTGGAAEFDVAARWEPSQLAEFEGASVTEIAFFPNEAAATYKVRVWVGAGAANMVVDQTVASPLIGQWNYVALTTPVPIDITNELWVGYYINTTTGYPAGCDDGPAIDGYGNMMNFGGWQTLLQINPDLDYNWNIQAHIQTVTGVSMPLAMSQQEMAVPQGAILSVDPDHSSISPVFAGSSNGSREMVGYNVYRSISGDEFELIDFTSETNYTDNYAFIVGELYCYKVTAVWESATDQCESAFSNEECVLASAIGDPNGGNTSSFSLYPNPADDHVFITTSGDLKRVTVYNALGQLVVDEIVTGKQYELKTTSYTIGVYMIRVETASGVNTRTLTIQR